MKTIFKPARQENYLNIDFKQNHHRYNLFLNYSFYETRSSWGHVGDICLTCDNDYNNEKRAHKKIRYYNRTWEQWKYQSLLHGLVYSLKLDKKLEQNIIKKIEKVAKKYYFNYWWKR